MTDIAAKLNTSDLYTRFPKERSMLVRLPKFKLEYNQELEEALTSIGKRKKMLHGSMQENIPTFSHKTLPNNHNIHKLETYILANLSHL